MRPAQHQEGSVNVQNLSRTYSLGRGSNDRSTPYLKRRIVHLVAEIFLEVLVQLAGADNLADLESYRLSQFFVALYLITDIPALCL
jgi:hypothetical protein